MELDKNLLSDYCWKLRAYKPSEVDDIIKTLKEVQSYLEPFTNYDNGEISQTKDAIIESISELPDLSKRWLTKKKFNKDNQWDFERLIETVAERLCSMSG